MLTQEIHPTQEREIQSTYPKLTEGNEFGFLQRLAARINIVSVGDGLFLGYCKIHGKYFVDRLHTSGEVRCPVCDGEWLRERGL